MADRIQIRRDTAANWTSVNPILAQGELGVETNTDKFKVGDGVAAWNSLSYLIDAGDYLTAASTNTLTNKTIAFADNTLTGVQPSLVSGTSIKTVNSTTLLGSGDLAVGDVTLDGVQTLTNKTLTSPQLNTPTATGLKETRVAIAASDIDLAAGNYFTRTISGTTTLTVSNTAASGSVSAFVLELTNGGSATVNYFSGVKWPAGTPPTLTASGRDVLAFFTHDGGTTWNAFVLGLDVK
jgi:hypothetical protein